MSFAVVAHVPEMLKAILDAVNAAPPDQPVELVKRNRAPGPSMGGPGAAK